MMTRTKIARPVSLLSFINMLRSNHQTGWTVLVLIFSIFLLSLLAGFNFETIHHEYKVGEVVEKTIHATREFSVEDTWQTEEKRKQEAAKAAPVYDLSMEAFAQLQEKVLNIINTINENPDNHDAPIFRQLAEEVGISDISNILSQLAKPAVQTVILRQILPKIREQMAKGLVWDYKGLGGKGVILIQNLDDPDETAPRQTELQNIPDTQSFLTELSSSLNASRNLNAQSLRAIKTLFSAILTPSLTENREATQKNRERAANAVKPEPYHVRNGEIIAVKGDRITREQELKIHELMKFNSLPFHWNVVGGSFAFGLILASGFFISPSGRAGTPLHKKDVILISVILLFFGLAAKGVYVLASDLDNTRMLHALMISFPVAGAVGLVAMVFAAKRYCTMGLLLSFYCMLMFHASYGLFFYYFISSMLATWLVTRCQNRQDVVWSVIPLSLGLGAIWIGLAFFIQTPPMEIPMQIISILLNSFLTLIILFAFSPVLEMIFGYSTRFRLMELMSLEHPLMQEIMVTLPGTYHHSLVVANMVEAGAKAIGANSLLCKVAALYHDAGKLVYPEYFIENLFGAPNKHDRLSPSISALVLLSHVKKGTELARKYNLGQEIIDIIRQHHGTRLMKFFYQKAIDLGEKPQEAEFSYPGPRPQTKEAAILMLADSVEASSRTLSDPTPARIKNHIDNIIKGIFSEGQLDESELTFKDLHYLSENFQRILTGIFHQRIAYPDPKKPSTGGASKNTKA